MKTAIQELFSQLEIQYPNLFNTKTLEGRKFINDYYKFYEIEKQNIIDAWTDGKYNYTLGNEENFEDGKQYYNETFNK